MKQTVLPEAHKSTILRPKSGFLGTIRYVFFFFLENILMGRGRASIAFVFVKGRAPRLSLTRKSAWCLRSSRGGTDAEIVRARRLEANRMSWRTFAALTELVTAMSSARPRPASHSGMVTSPGRRPLAFPKIPFFSSQATACRPRRFLCVFY